MIEAKCVFNQGKGNEIVFSVFYDENSFHAKLSPKFWELYNLGGDTRLAVVSDLFAHFRGMEIIEVRKENATNNKTQTGGSLEQNKK